MRKRLRPRQSAAANLIPGPDGVPVQTDMPRALETAEVDIVFSGYAQAARNARIAGFDGIPL